MALKNIETMSEAEIEAAFAESALMREARASIEANISKAGSLRALLEERGMSGDLLAARDAFVDADNIRSRAKAMEVLLRTMAPMDAALCVGAFAYVYDLAGARPEETEVALRDLSAGAFDVRLHFRAGELGEARIVSIALPEGPDSLRFDVAPRETPESPHPAATSDDVPIIDFGLTETVESKLGPWQWFKKALGAALGFVGKFFTAAGNQAEYNIGQHLAVMGGIWEGATTVSALTGGLASDLAGGTVGLLTGDKTRQDAASKLGRFVGATSGFGLGAIGGGIWAGLRYALETRPGKAASPGSPEGVKPFPNGSGDVEPDMPSLPGYPGYPTFGRSS